ncbi:DNA (cytosine-5-)-methyltransferase [Exiguobacterium sp. s194]|uniref:DNA (cytosine-5-)-methyltransferase n=1 Tax=Exiguobacterium sp. s194 TaxID=2751230 RepID=UPI001BE80010|nr:DNA (cytosine-5-)-methyltransferase [Exiguobacterium sp. s194]
MIKVVELFAGVGGFRIALEGIKDVKAEPTSDKFDVVWGNQWEPATKSQPAFDCYAERFKGRGEHVNEDIALTLGNVGKHHLLVGGFPCQDYSVSRSLKNEQGIQGKKGVLFWEIMNIVKVEHPPYVLLENVDRLMKSPAKQRGRDFSVMLRAFADQGYTVEWRVINAADYGFAQRRRRIFIFATRTDLNHSARAQQANPEEWLLESGFFAPTFPVHELTSEKHPGSQFQLPKDIVEISDTFSATYRNAGIMSGDRVTTLETLPKREVPKTLGEVVQEVYEQFGPTPEQYYLDTDTIKKSGRNEQEELAYLKGPKKIERTSASGHVYVYAEGGMSYPDSLDLPGRTMLTSEGTCNRSSHVIEDPQTKRLRYLRPEECEGLNGFPYGWTDTMTDRKRYFTMGNALVVGLIERMAHRIVEIHENEEEHKITLSPEITQTELFAAYSNLK